MSIFPRSTCRRNSSLWVATTLGFALLLIGCAGSVLSVPCASGDKGRDLPPFLDDFQAGRGHKPRALSLFLDDFLANTETHLVANEVEIPSAVGKVQGFWARPDDKARLPAVLMVHDQEAWDPWMRINTRHLASIGYEVLTLNVHNRRGTAGRAPVDEATLAELSAAVRWLRGRADVLPNRLGAVGWGWSGSQVLALASAMPLQACVLCDAPLPSEPSRVVGLRETPLLVLFGGADKASQADRVAFNKLLAVHDVSCKFHVADGAHAGFMGPPEEKAYAHDAAEDAWVAIYNFLEKHVEDARPSGLAAATGVGQAPLRKQVATIADIMRAVNEPSGIRGALSKALEQEPKGDRQWLRIRSNAALVAEAGALLETRKPAKGPLDHWKKQARAYTAAAEAMVSAADQKDYPAMQRGLVLLAKQCAACHDEHR